MSHVFGELSDDGALERRDPQEKSNKTKQNKQHTNKTKQKLERLRFSHTPGSSGGLA